MSQQDTLHSRQYITPGMPYRDFWAQGSESGLKGMDKRREAIAMRVNKQAKGAKKSGV